MNAKLNLKKEVEEIISKTTTKMDLGSGTKLNKELEELFKERGWISQSKVVNELGLSIDFEKERIGVEVQFGNVARLYADLFKLQVMSFSGKDKIDVGIIILPKIEYAKRIGSPIANFEKLVRELPYFKTALQVPLWIIGLEE